MHKQLFTAIALTALALTASAKPAAAIEYPWCAQYGGIGDGGRNCGFTTYAQCMATVSGIGGGCEHCFTRARPKSLPSRRASATVTTAENGGTCDG